MYHGQAVSTQQHSANMVKSNKETPEVQEFRAYTERKSTIQFIRDMLPVHKKRDVERILKIALMEYKQTPSLHKCTIDSVKKALISACRLGLEVGSLTGHAYLIPYGDQCTLQVGYKGLVECAYRSSNVVSIRARTVYEKDEFEILGGTEDGIRHKICLGAKGAVIGYYVIIELKNARPVFHYMSVAEIETHRNKFSAGGGKFWKDFQEQMAYKTVFIKLFKWLPNNAAITEVLAEEYSDPLNDNREDELAVQSKASKLNDLIPADIVQEGGCNSDTGEVE